MKRNAAPTPVPFHRATRPKSSEFKELYVRTRISVVAAGCALLLAAALSASAQDIQERTIRFGHLNNPDHPISAGVKKFAELVAAKSGGKMTVKELTSMKRGRKMEGKSRVDGGVQDVEE